MKLLPFRRKKGWRPKMRANEEDPNQFQGRFLIAIKDMKTQDVEKIVIERVVGSMVYPKFFEINSSHHCNMLSFYTQMLENRLPTQAELEEFELATQIKEIREKVDAAPEKSPN